MIEDDGPANWDVQVDRCLMNAAGQLAEATPISLDEHCQLAYNWAALAELWMKRQTAETDRQWQLVEIEFEEEEVA